MTRTITAAVAAVLLAGAGCKPAGQNQSQTPSRAEARTPPNPVAEPVAADPAPEPDPVEKPPVSVTPRTREPGTPNRLAGETSPFLLRHADDPVDWHPWGPEAFELARTLDVPIFLSIGYASDYWCHVMQRESFRNEEIAAKLNRHFVCVILDREERPDVDEIYKAAVSALNDRKTGWPMTVLLEPYTLKPFHGGIYDRPDRMKILLEEQATAWANHRERLLGRADHAAQGVARQLAMSALPVPLDAQDVENAIGRMLISYDRTHGGFGGGDSKFPWPSHWRFLLQVDWDNSFTRDAARRTLDRMAMGGIYDQVGGGFHRHSTDQRWLVPHFEKMLDTNALLASLYADAYERTRAAFYGRTVHETLDFVLRDLTGPGGRFYSAVDAEVSGRVGGSYVWTAEEVMAALEAADLDPLTDMGLKVYGLSGGTNFIDPHHPEDGEKNVLHMVDDMVGLARSFSTSIEELDRDLRKIDAALLAARDRREPPAIDDKTIVSSNGLMIAGLADGGRVLDEPRYVDAARTALDFILANLRTGDGRLLRAYRDGRAHTDALLVDYAYLIHGVLALHRATGDAALVTLATDLMHQADRDFADASGGGYFDTRADRPDLFVRTKSWSDTFLPSGNAVMTHNLLDLYRETGDAAYLERASAALGFMSSRLRRSSSDTPLSVLALHRIASEHPTYLPGGSSSPVSTAPPATITASVSRVSLKTDDPVSFEVVLDIADGYRIAAHEPGHGEVIPLRIGPVGDGVDVTVEYPEGVPFTGPKGDAAILVHEGRLVLPVTVRRSGEQGRPPSLMIVFQVCTESACMAPSRGLLPVTLEMR